MLICCSIINNGSVLLLMLTLFYCLIFFFPGLFDEKFKKAALLEISIFRNIINDHFWSI